MKTAVVLFNLGAPDCLQSVKPFLQNLFSDPAILQLPTLLRLPLASFIAWRRSSKAQEIYNQLGGGSPLLKNTLDQAEALEEALGKNFKTFVCMRYWNPLTKEVVRKVINYKPDRIILLPLYPQFSTTTTASSLKEWEREWNKTELKIPTSIIREYPENEGFIEALSTLTYQTLKQAHHQQKIRILFTAHGLPQKIVDQGDPYEYQINQSVERVIEKLPSPCEELNWEARVCYQSRVGPLKWLQPYADIEIQKAGQEKISLVVVPVSFVSEHSETLVELDKEYKNKAYKSGVPLYLRAPTVQVHPSFIEGLRTLVFDRCSDSK